LPTWNRLPVPGRIVTFTRPIPRYRIQGVPNAGGSGSGRPDDDTTLHVRGAIRGERASVEWVVTHFTPFLLAQAHYRVGRHLRGLYDPEDLVQRTWAIALGRLETIQPRRERFTPVLMRFLSSVLLQDYRNLLRKHINRRRELEADRASRDASEDQMAQIPATASGVTTKAVRSARVAELWEAMQKLSDDDREVLILRGIEQLPFKTIAEKVGVNIGTLRWRYHEALKRLKPLFPVQMIEELADEAA
jgi:RNA polymerase sigma-70 factor, ECF subfamily